MAGGDRPASVNGADRNVSGSRIVEKMDSYGLALGSPELRRAAAQQARAFEGGNSQAKSDAVRFFCEIRAKPVIEAIIESEDLTLAASAVDQGLAAFVEIGDVATLFRVASARAVSVSFDGEGNAIRAIIIAKLSARTAEILGIPKRPLSHVLQKERVIEWWREALADAPARLKDRLDALRESIGGK